MRLASNRRPVSVIGMSFGAFRPVLPGTDRMDAGRAPRPDPATPLTATAMVAGRATGTPGSGEW
jgi:hypothetical protein